MPPKEVPPKEVPPKEVPPKEVPPKEALPKEALPKETLPNRQVVRVMAKNEDSLPPATVAGAATEQEESGPAVVNDVAEYKVMVPFAMGKTLLGKDGEKAMGEIAQIGPIAKEIRIRAPVDPGGNLQRAYGRAAEIHRMLIKAGLGRHPITIEAVDAVPDRNVVRAEVALIVDLKAKPGQ
ncbi:MAG: hypothetical protein H6R10_3068 [Rhodocyclaceae bacterium]|nr:hypothetical protein [Rhodocyclaceae bacterium]